MQCDKVGVAGVGGNVMCGCCRAKEAWLRLGLYQNSQSQYTEAIKRCATCSKNVVCNVPLSR